MVGRFGSGTGPGEEVVVGLWGPEEIEVHCHGGVAAVGAIVATFIERGAQEITWQEWIARDEADAIAAEARVALAAARTERTAAILLDQYRGALRSELESLIRRMALQGHQVRHGSDGPEGPLYRVLPTANPLPGGAADVSREIGRLISLANVGLRLTQPWKVVIAGPPNVGKSSLLNAIVGYERAIVFNEPGTTRDVLTAPAAIDGWPLELADTAGLREAGEEIEAKGIARARQQISEADLVLLVSDLSRPTQASDRYLHDEVLRNSSRERVLIVRNKIDLAGEAPAKQSASAPREEREFLVSALTGEGIPQLLATIVQALIGDPPSPAAAIPFTERQVALLREAQELASRGELVAAAKSLRATVFGR
jgi:tRNA modification GTPase